MSPTESFIGHLLVIFVEPPNQESGDYSALTDKELQDDFGPI